MQQTKLPVGTASQPTKMKSSPFPWTNQSCPRLALPSNQNGTCSSMVTTQPPGTSVNLTLGYPKVSHFLHLVPHSICTHQRRQTLHRCRANPSDFQRHQTNLHRKFQRAGGQTITECQFHYQMVFVRMIALNKDRDLGSHV
jgi:hypothetical protein